MNYLSICLSLLLSLSHIVAQDATEELNAIISDIAQYERTLVEIPSTREGHPKEIIHHDHQAIQGQLLDLQVFQSRLSSIEVERLDKSQRITNEVMALKLDGLINHRKFRNYLIPFNAEGGFFNRISSNLNRLPFSSVEDLEAYSQWLPSYANWIQGYQKLMKQGIEEGIVAPKVIVKNTLAQLKPWIGENDQVHPMMAVISSDLEQPDDEKWNVAYQHVTATIEDYVLPAYKALYQFVKEEYYPVSADEPGISHISQGVDYYKSLVQYFTTLDMTPEEVFQKGQTEVKRIRAQMDDVIRQLEYKGDFREFLNYLRTDPRFYVQDGQALLSYAAWVSKKAEGQLPKLFSHLYHLPFTVEPVPDDIAPTYTSGRYVQGNKSQDRPGIYWVNTYNLPARALYNIPALTLHEAVPGHHLQIMLAAELEDLPAFRNRFYISAFGEGWGLYAEYLGEEMGMYEDPYDLFGRYTYEMWRACRLVVDVGLHYKGWSRAEAVDFLSDNTALSLHEVNTEIDRYIVWPGQALSYKIGELKIKELRETSENLLKDKFDIKEFHYRILRNGSIPLRTLEREIREWIEEKLGTDNED